jgi:hypothetical protein
MQRSLQPNTGVMKDQEAYLEFFADKGENFEDLCQKVMLEDDGTPVKQENLIK